MSEQLIQTPGVFGENGNFLLERELGSGGMGGVYMGRDKMLDRPVAVKVMLKELGSDPEFLEKFKKEAQSAARLIHPNIAQIYSYGIHENMPYIAMELASGGSLYSIMTSNPGKTDIPRVMKICQQVAQALQCATDQGCVHGDVKPENILLDANGSAKLVDFGLAAMQKDTSEIWGTPYYISPEKVKKEVLDFRADMYSLGGTLYHALTGVAPFEGEDSVAVVKKRFLGPPRKPSEIRPEITPQIDALVLKMLALDKNDRYPSFEALLKAFNDVLTSGLTVQTAGGTSSASAATTTSGSGARKLSTVRGGRRLSLRKRAPGLVKGTPDEDEKTPSKNESKVTIEDEDEEESGGNLGMKVLLFVLGGLLVIGGIGVSLYLYTKSDEESASAGSQQQITDGISKARAAVGEWRAKAEKFEADFAGFAASAVDECAKSTDELKKLLPDFADMMQPPPSEELVKAIALTNVAPKVEAPATNAVPTAVATNAAGAVAAPAAAAGAPLKRMSLQEEAKSLGIDPPPEDFDPASPDAEEFFAKLREARKRAKENPSAAAAPAKSPDAPAAEAPAEAPAAVADPTEKPKPPPSVITDLHELWNRAYSCQACAIRIAVAARKIVEECEKEKQVAGDSAATLNELKALTFTLKDLYEKMTTSPDVDTVKKGLGYIKSKGKKAVDQTAKRLGAEKREKERIAQKEAEEQAEKERLEKMAAEKKAKAEAEVTEIKAKFDSIVAMGCFRQLDWKSAVRQLNDAAQFFTSPEGDLALKNQLKKVESMKKVQDHFIKHMKGFVFRGKPHRGDKVVEVSEKEITVAKPDGTKQKILWQKFYKDCPGNFNEVINRFIVNGRKNCALNLRDWSDCMIGAAMTMKFVCAEVNGALEKSTSLAKDVVKQYPDYEKFAKEAFPDIDFSDAKGSEE